jgi:hypothetical protein
MILNIKSHSLYLVPTEKLNVNENRFFVLIFPMPYFFLDKKVTKSQAKKTLVTSL